MRSSDGVHTFKKVQAKMTSQTMALAKVASSTWRATLNKTRQVYSTIVRPAMTYAAPVWHEPQEIKRRGLGPPAKSICLQDNCLRFITGAYKAANVKVLVAESGVIPLHIYLDQAVLRARDAKKCSEVINLTIARICRKLRSKRGKKAQAKKHSIDSQGHIGQEQLIAEL